MDQISQTGDEDGWIGVDLDGTLVRSSDWRDMEYVGAPIPEMAERVKGWLDEGREVRIFTARVAPLFQPDTPKADRMQAQKAQWAIEDWCVFHFGEKLPVTAVKDFDMAVLYDDRCVPAETDTGWVLLDDPPPLGDAATRDAATRDAATRDAATRDAAGPPDAQVGSSGVPALVGEHPEIGLWGRLTGQMRRLLRMRSATATR